MCFFEHGRTLFERVALESRYPSNISLILIERISTLPCYILFQDCWGDYIVVYLDIFHHSTSKGLRRKMLFLPPLLVPLPCSFEGNKCFIHKTLAYLFLRVCWAIFTNYYFHSWRGFRRKTLYDFLPCPCSFAVPIGKQMGAAHGWKGLSSNVSAVDLAGRQWWLWLRRQCVSSEG